MCVLAFGLDLGLRSFVPRRVRLATTPALVLGIGASGSRGALLGVLLATAYLLLRRESRSKARRVALILLTGGAILVAFPVAGPLDVRTVYERTFGSEELDLSGREVAWGNMLRLSAERPLFGHGLRTSDVLLQERFATGAFDSGLGGHSGYLTMLVETGWVGALLLFAAVVVALRGRPRQPEDEPLWRAASGTVMAGLGHMTAESFVLGVGSPFPIVFWSAVVVMALLSTTRRQTVRNLHGPSVAREAGESTTAR
jgi:O-antigen ligase